METCSALVFSVVRERLYAKRSPTGSAFRRSTRSIAGAFRDRLGYAPGRMGRLLAAAAALAPIAVLASGCAATSSELRRAEEAYEQARYDASRVWLVDLEPLAPGMDPAMRARYFYLRGMAEFRLGHRLDALHYLAVARELTAEEGSRALREEQRGILARTLEGLQPRDRRSHRPPPSADAP
jgi:hypothetical protein